MKVGNDEVRPLFEAFGTVTECEVIKNYGSVSHSSFCASITLKNYFVMGTFLVTFYLTCRFVHMDSESASQEAIRNLNGKHDFHGRKMKVRSYFAIALNW